MFEGFNFDDTERAWQEIDKQFENRGKKPKKEKKVKWENPLQEKYQELFTKYANEFGHNDGSIECERLLDKLRAFERVFQVMGWNKYPKK